MVPGTVISCVYYDDFTSLYPDQSRKPLPYGKPEFVNGTDIDENFYGFIRCMVRTIDKDRKPLHGIKDHKTKRLLFPHFDKWTEIYLFSEEVKLGMKEGLYQYIFCIHRRYSIQVCTYTRTVHE